MYLESGKYERGRRHATHAWKCNWNKRKIDRPPRSNIPGLSNHQWTFIFRLACCSTICNIYQTAVQLTGELVDWDSWVTNIHSYRAVHWWKECDRHIRRDGCGVCIKVGGCGVCIKGGGYGGTCVHQRKWVWCVHQRRWVWCVHKRRWAWCASKEMGVVRQFPLLTVHTWWPPYSRHRTTCCTHACCEPPLELRGERERGTGEDFEICRIFLTMTYVNDMLYWLYTVSSHSNLLSIYSRHSTFSFLSIHTSAQCVHSPGIYKAKKETKKRTSLLITMKSTRSKADTDEANTSLLSPSS